ncbi:MAG: hypothetical protein ACLU9S_10825 [Oscillospiraceae bacterium]
MKTSSNTSDLVKGTLTITENDIDQVLLKSDGIPDLSLRPRRG